MPTINREWCEVAKAVITEAQELITQQLVTPLYAELPGVPVQDIAGDFFKKMRDLNSVATEISIALKSHSERPEIPDTLLPLFKGLFLRARLSKAKELDQQRARTTNPLVLQALEEKLRVYEGIIREAWFQAAVPEYPPSLGDVLTLERVERLDTVARPPDRQFDEKFHLLQAPTLFLPDLHYYRAKCGVRQLPVAIAFLDIDKFKDFNSAVGETHIDWHVLPVFMSAVEAHLFGHGYAYRFGGDEYALLMPNADSELAMGFLSGLRRRVGALRYHGTDRTITLSVGVCVADRDCFLTDSELLQRAERAKNFAKSQGRDCIAGYGGKLFDASELNVLELQSPRATNDPHLQAEPPPATS